MSKQSEPIKPLEYKGLGFFAGEKSYANSIRLERLKFLIVWKLFASWTPTRFQKWRRRILISFGADIAPDANVYGSARIWHPRTLTIGAGSVIGPSVHLYSMAQITIGKHVVISQRSYLCCGTHDIHNAKFQLRAKPITVGDDAWICSEAFVGPGVTVGKGAVLAARAAAFSDLEEWSVYVGNPAQLTKSRTQFDRRPKTPKMNNNATQLGSSTF